MTLSSRKGVIMRNLLKYLIFKQQNMVLILPLSSHKKQLSKQLCMLALAGFCSRYSFKHSDNSKDTRLEGLLSVNTFGSFLLWYFLLNSNHKHTTSVGWWYQRWKDFYMVSGSRALEQSECLLSNSPYPGSIIIFDTGRNA